MSIVLALAVLAGAGCEASDRLVGVWHVDGATQKVIEFSNHGTFASTCLGMQTGEYRIVSGGKAIEFRGEGKVVAMPYSLEGATMKLRVVPSNGAAGEWSFTRSASLVRPVK